MTYSEACAARQKAIEDLSERFCQAREGNPLTMSEMVALKISYDKANEEIWLGLFMNIVDTGVKFVRD